MYSIPGRDTQMVATDTTTELIQAVIKKKQNDAFMAITKNYIFR